MLVVVEEVQDDGRSEDRQCIEVIWCHMRFPTDNFLHGTLVLPSQLSSSNTTIMVTQNTPEKL